MSIFFVYLFAVVFSYLLGAVPFALVIGKGFYGVDVREHGSGNLGSTNCVRVLGTKPGLVVFFLDVAKAAAAVLLSKLVASLVVGATGASVHMEIVAVVAAVCAVLGHVFSPYVHFKGGKGVAAGLGGLLASIPFAGLCAFGVFILVFLITRYASLGSVLAGISLPFFVLLFYFGSIPYFLYGLFIMITLLITHRKNLVRLAHHEEKKLSFHHTQEEQQEDELFSDVEQAANAEEDR